LGDELFAGSSVLCAFAVDALSQVFGVDRSSCGADGADRKELAKDLARVLPHPAHCFPAGDATRA